MGARVFNFGAGPAMLPISVMEQVQSEFLDYNGIGASIIEISHRSKDFKDILESAIKLFRKLTDLPENYKVLFVHGGARMQFSAVPLNLIGRVPSKKALYFETGNFAKIAQTEAKKYGKVTTAASSANTNYDRIPDFNLSDLDKDSAYIHITSNNTIFGTRWNEFPEIENVPLVSDSTSEILSRKIDFTKFGVVYAGLQKNLGPSGLAIVIIREDLLGQALPETPILLDYAVYSKDNSLTNTNNTFAIYIVKLVLEWLDNMGGIQVIEEINNKKANLIYDFLDKSDFYKSVAHPDHRSIMNVTFNLPDTPGLLDKFLKEALDENLYALKGHRSVGGIRASIYNAMPVEGVETLVSFMEDFEKKNK